MEHYQITIACTFEINASWELKLKGYAVDITWCIQGYHVVPTARLLVAVTVVETSSMFILHDSHAVNHLPILPGIT